MSPLKTVASLVKKTIVYLGTKLFRFFFSGFSDSISNTTEKYGIITFCSYSSKIYDTVLLSDPETPFLWQEMIQAFVPFSIAFYLYIV